MANHDDGDDDGYDDAHNNYVDDGDGAIASASMTTVMATTTQIQEFRQR